MADLPTHGLNKDSVRADMQLACAIAHGVGTKLSLLELCALVLRDGLPNAGEREAIVAARHAEDDEGDNTTTSSSPS